MQHLYTEPAIRLVSSSPVLLDANLEKSIEMEFAELDVLYVFLQWLEKNLSVTTCVTAKKT